MNGDKTMLVIEKFAHGGFGVKDAFTDNRFAPHSFLFASASLDEVLAWTRQAMVPRVQFVTDGVDIKPGAINRVG